MPMFIKMGTGGTTGYLGAKQRTQRGIQMCAARRKIVEGYPVDEPFQNIEAVRLYLSGDKIICLRCGKSYRSLGVHIVKIHGMTIDQYKEFYHIPVTYALACQDSRTLYSTAMKKRINDGYCPPIDILRDMHEQGLIKSNRRTSFFKAQISTANLGDNAKPRHPLQPGPSGTMETFTQRRERLTSRRGSRECMEKMKAAGQRNAIAMGRRMSEYWKGRSQTPEHLRNRMKAIYGDQWEPKEDKT